MRGRIEGPCRPLDLSFLQMTRSLETCLSNCICHTRVRCIAGRYATLRPILSVILIPQLWFYLLSYSRRSIAYAGRLWMDTRKSEESMLQRWRARWKLDFACSFFHGSQRRLQEWHRRSHTTMQNLRPFASVWIHFRLVLHSSKSVL